MSIYSEIKKYLLVLVGFFCVVIVAHLVLLYIYHDAVRYPLGGGTINVGVVTQDPPLTASEVWVRMENNPTTTTMKLLYRGLIRYAPYEKKIVGDLATCTTDSFPTVRCALNENAIWNDGGAVTNDDIIASYAYYQNNSTDTTTASLLKLIDITESDNSVVFRFKSRNITHIQALFLPILRAKDIKEGWDGMITETLSFSGPYVYEAREDRDTILLKRSNAYPQVAGPFFFDHVRLGFAPTLDELKSKIRTDLLISNTTDSTTASTPFIQPLQYGVFLHATRLPLTLRRSLVNDILKPLDFKDNSLKPLENIFFSEVPSSPSSTKENAFFETVFWLGYSFWGTFQVTQNTPQQPIATKKPLKYIASPGSVSPLFLSSTAITLQWTPPAGTTRIVVNDYTLKTFKAGKKSYMYSAQPSYGNLNVGKNDYRVTFYAGTKVLAEETLSLYHSTDLKELDTFESEWTKANTPATAPAPTVVKQENLDPKKLYNKSGKPLALTIVVPEDIPSLVSLSENLNKKLTELGVEVTQIELTTAEIDQKLHDPEFTYDILLTGFHLGLLYYDISPFFHSSGIKSGYNMSRVNNASLDSMLGRLTDRLYFGVPDSLRALQLQLQKYLDTNALYMPIGSPIQYLTLNDSILGIKAPEFVVGYEVLPDIIAKWYSKEGYRPTFDDKNILSFFVWLKNALFPNT